MYSFKSGNNAVVRLGFGNEIKGYEHWVAYMFGNMICYDRFKMDMWNNLC